VAYAGACKALYTGSIPVVASFCVIARFTGYGVSRCPYFAPRTELAP